MQIKCCFHNHSSVPLSEVRFFVIKVKGTCTRGRVRSFAPTNQPANQPSRRTNHHPLTHPTTNYPSDFNNRKLRHAPLCVMLIKRSLFSCHRPWCCLLSPCSLSFFSASIVTFCDRNKRFEQLYKIHHCCAVWKFCFAIYINAICHIEYLFLISLKI